MDNRAASRLKNGHAVGNLMCNITLSSLIKIIFHDHDKAFSLNLFSYANREAEVPHIQCSGLYNLRGKKDGQKMIGIYTKTYH
jgi:hypothetical protein